MTITTPDSGPAPRQVQHEGGIALPYVPSFIDRFTKFIQRLPIPYGLTYLLLFILESAIILVISLVDGRAPAYEFDPIIFIFPLWLWGPLAIVTYLDSLSVRVFSEFGQLLDLPTETKRRMEYEFTTMPARSVLISAIVWSVVYLFIWFLAWGPGLAVYGFGAFATWVNFFAGFVSFFLGSVIYYHTIRQLRLVGRTVRLVEEFDLFRLEPVYAFSVLTSRTGISWVALITLTLLISPLEVGGAPTLSLLIVQVALAIGAFLLPLRAVNRRLVLAKRIRMAELDQRTKTTLERMHHLIDQDTLQEVSNLNDVLKGLITEREILEKKPTWPWRPGLFAGFVSIIVLPIVLFLIQFALERWLEP